MTSPPRPSAPPAEHVLGEPTLAGLAHYIKTKDVRRILVLVGAGASVAAGIPDFRSPDTGIYANLGKYNLDDPTDAFSLALLRQEPQIFYTIAQEMNLWPGHFRPTPVHHFIRLLQDEGRLLRCCTQNIDGLERAAGVSPQLLVEAHGSFASAGCIDCRAPFSIEQNRIEAMNGVVSHCPACGGIVKPDVVFFGESLPDAFFDALHHDAPVAELVIIVGTSLQVHPFASLPCFVPKSTPRVVINRERVGGFLFRFPDDPFFDVHDADSAGGSGDADAAEEEEQEEEEEEGKSMRAASSPPAHCTLPQLGTGEGGDAEVSDSPPSPDTDTTSSSSSSDGYAQYGDYDAHPEVCRDVLFRGDCQENVLQLTEHLGLAAALAERMRAFDATGDTAKTTEA